MANNVIVSDDEKWTQIIRPQRGWWDLRLGEVWQYRDLARLMIWRDFVSEYKQTILGPIWHLIRPLLSSGVYTVVFSNVAKLSTDSLPPFLFYMAGNTIWSYFSSCLSGTSNTFMANKGIFGKVYFPRLIIPLAGVLSDLITFGIRFSIFVVVLLYFLLSGSSVRPNLYILLLPILLMIMAGIGAGMGMIVSSLSIKYRDLQQILGFIVQLMMYASPVIYPFSAVPAQWRWLLLANPITPVIEMFRKAFLGVGSLEPVYLLYSVAFMLVVLLIGALIFNHVENTFVDTV